MGPRVKPEDDDLVGRGRLVAGAVLRDRCIDTSVNITLPLCLSASLPV